MKRALLLLAGLAGGCGGADDPPANQAADAPTPTMAMPINNAADKRVEPIDAAPPPALPPSKPLVSRETSAPRPAAPAYRAIGTEPFWAVMVQGSTATLERPDQPALQFAVSRDEDGRAIRYRGEGFAMTLTHGPCSDGMSDAIWSDRVQVAFGEGALKGCGGDREPGDMAP